MSTAVGDAVAGLDIRSRAFVDGEYVDALSGETFDCVSPVTGETIALFPRRMLGTKLLGVELGSPPAPLGIRDRLHLALETRREHAKGGGQIDDRRRGPEKRLLRREDRVEDPGRRAPLSGRSRARGRRSARARRPRNGPGAASRRISRARGIRLRRRPRRAGRAPPDPVSTTAPRSRSERCCRHAQVARFDLL